MPWKPGIANASQTVFSAFDASSWATAALTLAAYVARVDTSEFFIVSAASGTSARHSTGGSPRSVFSFAMTRSSVSDAATTRSTLGATSGAGAGAAAGPGAGADIVYFFLAPGGVGLAFSFTLDIVYFFNLRPGDGVEPLTAQPPAARPIGSARQASRASQSSRASQPRRHPHRDAP